LIIEARKFIKKLLVISTDWKAFEGMAEIVKPLAWIPLESSIQIHPQGAI